MKKLTVLVLVLAFIMPLSGCASLKYPNWDKVRIEKEVPQKDCVYKFQQGCGKPSGACFNYFKKVAAEKGANVVVITEMSKGKDSTAVSLSGLSMQTTDTLNALADFYYCPNYKFGEQK